MIRPVIAAAVALLCSCRGPQSPGLKIAIADHPAHLQPGPANIQIKVLDAHNAPVSNAKLSVEADMSHPGMAPVFATTAANGNGTYNASVNFTMPGDWILLVTAVRTSGERAEKQQNVTIEAK